MFMLYAVYYFLVGIHGAIWGLSGFGIDSWQMWISLFCVIGAHILGCEIERRRNR